MFNIEFGRHDGPKWVREWYLQRETLDEARKLLFEISDEFKRDATCDFQVKVIDKGNRVNHYITTTHPGVWTGE